MSIEGEYTEHFKTFCRSIKHGFYAFSVIQLTNKTELKKLGFNTKERDTIDLRNITDGKVLKETLSNCNLDKILNKINLPLTIDFSPKYEKYLTFFEVKIRPKKLPDYPNEFFFLNNFLNGVEEKLSICSRFCPDEIEKAGFAGYEKVYNKSNAITLFYLSEYLTIQLFNLNNLFRTFLLHEDYFDRKPTITTSQKVEIGRPSYSKKIWEKNFNIYNKWQAAKLKHIQQKDFAENLDIDLKDVKRIINTTGSKIKQLGIKKTSINEFLETLQH